MTELESWTLLTTSLEKIHHHLMLEQNRQQQAKKNQRFHFKDDTKEVSPRLNTIK